MYKQLFLIIMAALFGLMGCSESDSGEQSFSSSALQMESSSSISSENFSSGTSCSLSSAFSSSESKGINSTLSRNELGYFGKGVHFGNHYVIGYWLEALSYDEVIDQTTQYVYAFDENGTGKIAYKESVLPSQVSDIQYGVNADGSKITLRLENNESTLINIYFQSALPHCLRIIRNDSLESYERILCQYVSTDVNQTYEFSDNSSTMENEIGFYGSSVKLGGFNLTDGIWSNPHYGYDTFFIFDQNGTVDRYSKYNTVYEKDSYYFYGVDHNGTYLEIQYTGATPTFTKTAYQWSLIEKSADCLLIQEKTPSYSIPGEWDSTRRIYCKGDL